MVILKCFKKSISYLLLVLYLLPSTIFAYSKYIIPGGENLAIEVSTKGVLVVGFYDINGISPGKDAHLKIGDNIIKINDTKVSSIDELVNEVNKASNIIKVTYIRNNMQNTTNLKVINNEGILKTGLYVKDSLTGIGTLTYIDPETKLYGA